MAEPFRISHEDSVLAQAGTQFHLALVRAEGSTDAMLRCEVAAARRRLIRAARAIESRQSKPLSMEPVPE